LIAGRHNDELAFTPTESFNGHRPGAEDLVQDCRAGGIGVTSAEAFPISTLPCQEYYKVCCNSAEEGSRNLDDTLKSVKPWVTFAGGVLVVAVLYWAQAVLVPFALAILFTFVLTPPVTCLQRWVGRVPAVLLVVTQLSVSPAGA